MFLPGKKLPSGRLELSAVVVKRFEILAARSRVLGPFVADVTVFIYGEARRTGYGKVVTGMTDSASFKSSIAVLSFLGVINGAVG